MHLIRFFKIVYVCFRFGLEEFILGHRRVSTLRLIVRWALFWRPLRLPRGARLRIALEQLGPIFVKFGQVLSTRRDILPADVADELSKLQDQVPPFSSAVVLETLGRVYGKPAEQIFKEFDPIPIASASVAQVHFATLWDGREAAVKILRPEIKMVIGKDVALMKMGAGLIERLWSQGRRLKLREIVAEFEKHLQHEQDLMREAANASQLRRNFVDSSLLRVPEVYWDYCVTEVMVMQRMKGTSISKTKLLREQGIDVPKLAKAGVEIFFTQVFRDGFFHADMHPGNIFVDADGKYIALDFGIMGTLTDADKNYLAQNFLAFFRRDYRRVAQAHIDARWVHKDIRIDEFEAAIRAVSEPIFDRPLKDISFGRVLLQLFQASREFNIDIQPQLVLLQKTLLNVEGLGRELDPELDLWKTAKPYLERWMSEQVGLLGLFRRLKDELPQWTTAIPEIPRLVHQMLSEDSSDRVKNVIDQLLIEKKRQTKLLALGLFFIAAVTALYAYTVIA